MEIDHTLAIRPDRNIDRKIIDWRSNDPLNALANASCLRYAGGTQTNRTQRQAEKSPQICITVEKCSLREHEKGKYVS